MMKFKEYLDKTGEIGFVETAARSIVYVNGLPKIRPYETVVFETGEIGVALFIHEEKTEILLFSDSDIAQGTKVARTGEFLGIMVGEKMLGCVVDPLGKMIFGHSGVWDGLTKKVINTDCLGISYRSGVKKPLETGVSVVDTLVPLGQGQRELVIGDGKIGKTSFLLQAVLSQAKRGTVCIFAVIGKRMGVIKQAEEFFRMNKVLDKVIIVAAGAYDPPGLIYLAPYSAIMMAEYFRDKGIDSLVVLDDLTTHAKFYREIALTGRRFPGRDSYPVDIFYSHAWVMEKGGNFKIDAPGGASCEVSISILPVAETTSGDLSGYIQTNLMSMTDGHIYFDKDLFGRGQRPCVNPYLSVTRVGKQAQSPLKREATREVLAFLSEYEKLKSFVHFGAELTDEVKASLDTGEKVFKFFQQPDVLEVSSNISVFILGKIWNKQWQGKTSDGAREDFDKIIIQYNEDSKFRENVDRKVEESKSWKELCEKALS